MCKSKIMGIEVDNGKVSRAATKFGCLLLKAPFLYLGSYVGGDMNKIQSWKDIMIELEDVPEGIQILESLDRKFFTGLRVLGNKASWVQWKKLLSYQITYPDNGLATLNNSGGYTVFVKNHVRIRDYFRKVNLKTRWIRLSQQVEHLRLKGMTNSLPTRFNISRRGIDIESLSCVNCDVGIETNVHFSEGKGRVYVHCIAGLDWPPAVAVVSWKDPAS
ncbi:hypothetical protein Tco_1352377 [Tanacetum coccineum]